MPNPISYNKSTIYGASTCDYLWVFNDIASQQAITDTLVYNFEPEWISPTLLLALFNDSINGGNIKNLEENIVSWSIYREEPNTSVLKFIATLPAEVDSLTDYNIENNKGYRYLIFPVTESMVGLQMAVPENEFTAAEWFGWSIIQLVSTEVSNLYYADPNNIWNLDLNIQIGNTTQQIEKFQVDNFSKYPSFSVGKKNSVTGQVTCLIGRLENINYEDTVEMRHQFQDFVANKNYKLLRDSKGNSYIVETTANSFKYNDELEDQITTINLTFVEIESLEDINIIE